MRRVLDAGATIVGKTNCEYLCLSSGSHTSDYGATHNPRRPGFTSGGSSSGNAVAIVAGDADLALGTGQAGSIRVPASYSGLVGLKPTHGLVPYTGISPLDPVIDHAGPMNSTVDDSALLLSVIAGYDEYDPRQRRIADSVVRETSALRIGVLREGFTGAAVSAVVREAATELGRLGMTVSECPSRCIRGRWQSGLPWSCRECGISSSTVRVSAVAGRKGTRWI
jgi:amidase